MNWYYQSEGKRTGPVDETTIRQLILNGTIRFNTMVWNNNLPMWMPFGQIPDDIKSRFPQP